MTPLFIVFEGPDGAGKSTLVQALCATLEGLSQPVWPTAEPTRGPFGTAARARLHDAARLDEEISSLTPDLAARSLKLRQAEALGLFLADRLSHLEDIAMHLGKGETVVCDRYALSTWAYQAQFMDANAPDALKLCMASVRAPDLTVLVETPEAVLLERVRPREGADPVETEVQTRRHAEAYRRFTDSLLLFRGLRGVPPAHALHADSDLQGAGLFRHPLAPGPFLRVSGLVPTERAVACILAGMDAIAQRRHGPPPNDHPRGEFG
jgi:dTMP kinase